ncbi:DUF4251 domain-containing protein [Salinimicrobium oceani]|uniref:DUF4251 domain-containing protein n=1 Tax=Salinimicrobium oceani TaxID=2722702 RepID=A0ABX1CYM3_9FLAO|nr:DUF4251 domain-containing protein [Salinimicrobium oceani]NJW53360.1 DUF4251 domain-containing protein [Salinimicrobium oceani]
MRNILVLVTLFALLLSCGSTDVGNANSAEYQQMLEQVKDLEFEIENQWANPTKYGRVNLIGNPNHIKFENDSVDIFLPFVGERHAGGGYGGEAAIKYEGIPQDLKIEERPGKNQAVITFKGNHKGEYMDFRIAVFQNGNTSTSVTSSQRDQIDYDGKIVRE